MMNKRGFEPPFRSFRKTDLQSAATNHIGLLNICCRAYTLRASCVFLLWHVVHNTCNPCTSQNSLSMNAAMSSPPFKDQHSMIWSTCTSLSLNRFLHSLHLYSQSCLLLVQVYFLLEAALHAAIGFRHLLFCLNADLIIDQNALSVIVLLFLVFGAFMTWRVAIYI